MCPILFRFIPTKSLDNNATDDEIGSSLIVSLGIPDIGKSRPFDIFITFVVCLNKVANLTIKNT